MRYSFIPLLVASVVILTSLSDCKNIHNWRPYAPISAEINGTEYSSDYHDHIGSSEYARYGISSGEYRFDILRHLYSSKNDVVTLAYRFSADTLVCNEKYNINNIILWTDWDGNRYYDIYGVDGHLEFTKIDTVKRQIAGKFEFIVSTARQIYNIKKGMFDVPYLNFNQP